MIAIILGTRPEIIKMSPIIRECERKHRDYFILHTGQHYSYDMDKIFFDELELPHPKYNLDVGSGTHAVQTGAIMAGTEKVLGDEKPDIVLVQGDTNTVVAGALAAAKLHIKVGHVEAGLRSFDRTMPEEINRVVADHIADYLFAPTEPRPAEPREGRDPREPDHGHREHDRRRPPREPHDRREAEEHPPGPRPQTEGVPPRDRPPAGERRRPRAPRRDHRGPQEGTEVFRHAARLPGPPPGREEDRGVRHRHRRSHNDQAGRVPRVFPARVPGPARPHRLGRRPGGDLHPRRPLRHPPREHRAARDGPGPGKRPRGDEPRRHLPGGRHDDGRGARLGEPVWRRVRGKDDRPDQRECEV